MICGHLKQPEKQNQASGNITITIIIFIKQQPLMTLTLQFANICPCAEADWLPTLVNRKVAMICAFTISFPLPLLLLLATLPGLSDTL